MSNRRSQGSKQKFPPKPKGIVLNINIWEDRFPASTDQGNSSRLGDFKNHLRAHNFQVDKTHDPVTVSGNAKNIKIELKTTEHGNTGRFFERLRRQWCSSICRRGDSFWLESAETHKNTFKYKSDGTRQILQPASFSLGSFFDRGTYIKHWCSDEDAARIEDGSISSDFEHDTKTLTITYFKAGALQGFKEVHIEMEYRQFENYVVVDENISQGTIQFYFPLQWPPRVSEEVTGINDYINYDRLTHFLGCSREILGSSSVLCVTFPLEQVRQQDEAESPLGLMTALSSRGFSVFFAAMRTKSPRGPTEAPRKPALTDDRILYALECLLSRGYKVRDRVSRKFYDLLRLATDRYESLQKGKLVSPEKVSRALYRLVNFVESDRFCPLEYYLDSLLYGDMKHLTAFEFELPKHYVYIPRLIITPTQDYLLPAELVAENRVIRDYGHKQAIRIAFRDEDFSKLASTYPDGLRHVLNERVVDKLSNNIEIAGRDFEFLACSNSQLRDHGAWLFATDGEHRAADIRGSLGQLDGIRCVASYVSRMGQCFSSTKEAVTVSIEVCKVEEIPDVQVQFNNVYFKCCNSFRSGTYTFSDGVGKISRALARKVAGSLDLDPVPSAYQIRFGGCKGMLAIDPKLPQGEQQEILQFRKSMNKFHSPHSALEICESTKPNLLYLNRQCIILLNGLGVPEDSFISLQDNMLRNLALMLLFETVALDTLRHANIPGGLKITPLSHSGVNFTREPFFRSLLLAIYKSRLGDLLRRARIAIPESHGRLLMGVIDETGSLEYGQVFVRYSKTVNDPGRELITLKGRVVISKNPCFHPGDMRLFEAVDVRALHHLVDCVVFPAKGPRPHTDEMSGSDLDGDKYFVTWYDKLLPPREENVEPMDFTSPVKKELSRPVQVSDMIQFVADYIKNDQLGIIANAHLVHADHEEKGIFSSKCIMLAHMHSVAVDFPKTGECPSLPKELRPDQYPDFMMKPGKPRYNSQKILGKLFRKCKSLDRAQQFSGDASQTQITIDDDMLVPGYEQYLDEARAVRNRYNTKLEGLMSLYGLRNEGEIITGCLVRVNTRLSGKTDEKFEVAQMIQASLSTLRAKTRHDFYDEFGGEEEVMEEFEENGVFSDEVMKKASAWYMTTYGESEEEENASEDQTRASSSNLQRNQQRNDVGSQPRLLSFPWIVDRILAKIKDAKQKERKEKGIQKRHTLNAVGDLITVQATYFFEKFQLQLIEDRQMRIQERDKLHSILHRLLGVGHAPHMCLCDASLTGISVGDEERRHIDIYVHYKWNASQQEQYEYLRQLGTTLSQAGDVQISRTHPFTLHFQRSQGLLRQQYHITADSNRLFKSAYVGVHVQRCPRLLHLLLIVMHWGQRRRINGNSKHCFLSDENLAILFIVFCERSGFIHKLGHDELQNFSSSLLGLPSSATQSEAEDLWSREVLGEVFAGSLKGFKDDSTPGYVVIKFFEYYSTMADNDPLHIRVMKNPVNDNETLCPNVSLEESGRFSDAAFHAFHELAQCCGLDRLTASLNTESSRELQEMLNMPNTTWGALRLAEEFVRVKLSTLTSAKITLRRAQKGGYILEATGDYLTLHSVQNELEKLETTCTSYIFDHTVSGATRFLFLNQNGPEDSVTFKRLKRDFAVNLNGACSEDFSETKFRSILSSQLETFRREHLPYVHGTDRLKIKAEFGSIYVENVQSLMSRVEIVENTLSQSADPKHQRRDQNVMRHKFIPISRGADGWSAAFETRPQESTEERYTLGIKEGKNHTRIVIYDSDLQFCDVEIPPINWVVVDVKAPRPARSKSRDIDFRVTVCSERRLEGEEKDEVMKSANYEMFRTKSVITKAPNGGPGLVLANEFLKKVSFVRHEKTSMYQICNGNLSVQVKEVQKYDVKGTRFLNCPSKSFTELQICGWFDGKADDMVAMTVATDLWAATKTLRPHING